MKGATARSLVQKCVGLGKIRKRALNLPGSALTVHVPKPLHPAINTSVNLCQSATAIRVERMNNLKFQDSA